MAFQLQRLSPSSESVTAEDLPCRCPRRPQMSHGGRGGFLKVKPENLSRPHCPHWSRCSPVLQWWSTVAPLNRKAEATCNTAFGGLVPESRIESYEFRMDLALVQLVQYFSDFFMSKAVVWMTHFMLLLALPHRSWALRRRPLASIRVSHEGNVGVCLKMGGLPWFIPKWWYYIYIYILLYYMVIYCYLDLYSIARGNYSNDDWPVDLEMRYHSQFSDKNPCHKIKWNNHRMIPLARSWH